MGIVRTALIGLMLIVGGQAHALLLTTEDAYTSQLIWTDYVNPDAADVMAITGGTLELALLYKDNEGGAEEGLFLDSYDTTYTGSATDPDPSNAYIRFTGGDSISSDPLWLLVKDGVNQPSWYLFDISTWDGTETISLEGFWPAQGAISHVSIFGTASVPEPASLLLFSLGLMGIGFAKRRRT